MPSHKLLRFKIERLDANDNLVEEKTVKLIDGEVKVAYDDINRRTCSFELLEPLSEDWMGSRWKLYYGTQSNNGVVTYDPLGVFLPINPVEDEDPVGYTTKFQGVDKAQLLADAYSDIPITYAAGTTLKEIAIDIFDRIGETKRNFEDVPYELATEFTFEESVTLEHILSTLVRSFPADWYYDRNGIAVLESLPVVTARPIKHNFVQGDDSIYTQSSRNFDTGKYWNRVVVVGGKADTAIFRQTYDSPEGYAQAGRYITKFFKEDAATSQDQVNDLATQFLDAGLRLPANINIHNIPLTDLEPKQVIQKGEVKYEVIEFNIPLSTDLQQIQAGEVF